VLLYGAVEGAHAGGHGAVFLGLYDALGGGDEVNGSIQLRDSSGWTVERERKKGGKVEREVRSVSGTKARQMFVRVRRGTSKGVMR